MHILEHAYKHLADETDILLDYSDAFPKNWDGEDDPNEQPFGMFRLSA